MVPSIPFVVVYDLRNPQGAWWDEENRGIVQEDILVNKEDDEPHVDTKIEYQKFPFEGLWVHHQVLVVHFEGFLQKPHLEHKGVKEVGTARKLEEIVAWSHVDEDKMLPKEAEVPDH